MGASRDEPELLQPANLLLTMGNIPLHLPAKGNMRSEQQIVETRAWRRSRFPSSAITLGVWVAVIVKLVWFV